MVIVAATVFSYVLVECDDVPSPQPCRRSSCRWLRSVLFLVLLLLLVLITSRRKSSFPRALLQARESVAILSSSTKHGTSSSSMTGRGLVFSTAVSVTVPP